MSHCRYLRAFLQNRKSSETMDFLKVDVATTSVYSVLCYDFSVIGGMEAVYLYKASLSKQVFLDRFLFLSLLSLHLALLWQPTCLFVALLKHGMHQTSSLHIANIFMMPCTLMKLLLVLWCKP